MVFYNLNKEELFSTRHSIKYGTEEYFKYSLMEMVDSVYCYNHYGNNYDKYLNNKYIMDYYLDTSFINGARLSKEVVEEVVKNRVDYLCENTSIKYSVYTDEEDVTYNHLVFKESE